MHRSILALVPLLKLAHSLENSTNSTDYNGNYLYEGLKIYFLNYYIPAIWLIGILGNCGCFFFLYMSRLFAPNMLIWLYSICFGDFMTLLLEGSFILLKVWYNYDLRDINQFGCKIHISASNYFIYWSAYMQCFLSLERAYMILRPIKARGNSLSIKKTLSAHIAISIGLLIPISVYFINWEIKNGDCDPYKDSIYHLSSTIDFVVWGIIPVLGMTSSTIVIGYGIYGFRKAFSVPNENEQKYMKFSSFSSSKNVNSQPPTGYMNQLKRLSLAQFQNSKILHQHRSSISLSVSRANLKSSHSTPATPSQYHEHVASFSRPLRHGGDNSNQITTLLICLNLWYMVSTYPFLIYLMYKNFIQNQGSENLHRFCYYLSRSLCLLSASTNWIFYCITGTVFRRKAKKILKDICCYCIFSEKSTSDRMRHNERGSCINFRGFYSSSTTPAESRTNFKSLSLSLFSQRKPSVVCSESKETTTSVSFCCFWQCLIKCRHGRKSFIDRLCSGKKREQTEEKKNESAMRADANNDGRHLCLKASMNSLIAEIEKEEKETGVNFCQGISQQNMKQSVGISCPLHNFYHVSEHKASLHTAPTPS